jgi:hypothetical protein
MFDQDDLIWLGELSRKINEQDKRGTSYPLFVVYDKKQIFREDGEERARKSEYDGELCARCEKDLELTGDLQDDCEDCPDDAFYRFDWEDQICEDDGIYLTAEACNEYIARRRYNFNKPYSYAISAYYSEEMKRLMEIISKLTREPGNGSPLK